MFIKRTVQISALATALVAGLHAQPASAECIAQFRIPTSLGGSICTPVDGSGDSATGNAFDSSGGNGTEYSYNIELDSGSITAIGILLDEDLRAVQNEDGENCPQVEDRVAGDGDGDGNFCEVSFAFAAVTYFVFAD